MDPDFDIGDIIRIEFEKKGWSVAHFADQIKRDRTIAYRIFRRKIIDTALLYDISMALNIDFFDYFSQQLQKDNSIIRHQKERAGKLDNKKRILVEFELSEEEFICFLHDHSVVS